MAVPNQKPSRSLALALVAVVIVILAIAAGVGFRIYATMNGGGGGWGGFSNEVAVDTIKAGQKPVAVTYETVGTVEADNQVDLKAQTDGRVVHIGFQEGDVVALGRVLLKLDAAQEAARLQESSAQIQAAQQGVFGSQAQLAQLEADLQAYRSRKNLAQSEYDRYQKLFEGDFVSALERDQKRSALETATADYNAQLKRYDAARANVGQAQANTAVSAAMYRSATAQFSDTVIRAPVSGIIGQKYVSLGDTVKLGDRLVTVVDTDPLKIRFTVPQQHLSRLAMGATVQVHDETGHTTTGRVVFVDPAVDAANREVAVKALLNQQSDQQSPPDWLRPGQFLTVALVFEEHPTAIVIPEEALFSRGETEYVYRWVQQGGKAVARMQKITVGQRLPGELEVLSGLSEGQVVITSGLQKLQDGAAVKQRGRTKQQ